MASWQLPARTKTAVSSDTGGTYYALSDWIPASSTKEIKAVLWMTRRSNSSINVTPAFQTAASKTDEPDSWSTTGMGSGVSADGSGVCTGIVPLSTTLSSKWYIRFGVLAALTSGTSTQSAEVRLTVSGRD